MRPDVLLPVLGRRRGPERLDWPCSGASPDLDDLVAATETAPPGVLWLSGGEPTLRRDLPALITALPEAGLDTDGLALRDPRVVRSLCARGLKRVRVSLHAGSAAAHDWLVGVPGAARGARAAVVACREAGVEVHALVVPTRPTMELLPETVSLLVRLGVSTVRIRRLRKTGPAAERYVTLSPRLGLLEPYLEAAVARGDASGCPVVLEGFPGCAAPRVAGAAFVAPSRWLAPAGWPAQALPGPQKTAAGCGRCEERPSCAGAPADYVAQFGRVEIESERAHLFEREVPTLAAARPGEPPPRQGRAPATRIRTAVRLARSHSVGGDPLRGSPPRGQRAEVRVHLHPERTRRQLRQELVRAVQDGAPLLRVTGDFAHTAALAVVRDALRLPRVAVRLEGDLSSLETWSQRDVVVLRRLAGVCPSRPGCPGAARLAALGVPLLELQTG